MLLLQLVEDRWEYLHSPIHSVGALLNSRLWSDPNNDWSQLRNNPELKKDFMDSLEKFFPGDMQKQANALNSLRKFWNREGIFSSELVRAQAMQMSIPDFWDEWGWEDPEMQEMGRKVTAQPTAMTSGERNWKDHADVHCPTRNRLNPKKARDLVFVSHSLRLQEKAHEWQLELAKPAKNDQWWRPCIGDSSEDESDEE
jgi:hypothetical protein